jgi:hypothetical protein
MKSRYIVIELIKTAIVRKMRKLYILLSYISMSNSFHALQNKPNYQFLVVI